MKFGYFDDEKREYVVTSPKTPLPWINYLGSDGFFRLISNTGGGYAFYRDASLMRLTRYRYNDDHPDSNGHYIYIKDGNLYGIRAGSQFRLSSILTAAGTAWAIPCLKV